MTLPNYESLLNIVEKRHQIAAALCSNLDSWIVPCPNYDCIAELLDLDIETMDLSDIETQAEIQRAWVAYQVDEMSREINAKIYDESVLCLMGQKYASY